MWISFLLKKFFTSSINSIVRGYLTQKKVECFTDFYPASLKDANFKRGSVTCSIFSWMNSHVLIAIGLQVKAGQRSV